MATSTRFLAFPALLLLSACGPDAEAPPPDQEVALPGAEVPAGARPYTAPPGFPLPFRTVVPAGFRTEPEVEADGAAVRFIRTAGPEGGDSAFVYVRVMDEGTSEGRAREIVRSAAERLRIPGDRSELTPADGHPWAVVEYPLISTGTAGERVRGWVALGHHGGRWFYLIAQATVELWPRFEPEVERILSEWRWTGPGGADGAGLGAGR